MKKIVFLIIILLAGLAGCDKHEPEPILPPEVEKPVITGQPASKEVVIGENVTLKVTATGTMPQYQWYKNNTPVAGATAATFSATITQLSDAGNFSCTVSNEGGSASSEKATVAVCSSFSWGNFKLSLGNVDWRVRTTTAASDVEIEFYNPKTSEWHLLSWSGGTSKGSKSNAKLITSSPGGSEQEITLTSFEVVEVYQDLYHVKLRSGSASGELVRPISP